MKTKIIPFDLETAKKIQAGEIEGRILYLNDGISLMPTRIVCWDRKDTKLKLIGLYCTELNEEGVLYLDKFGRYSDCPKLVIELPEEAPKTQADLCEEGWLEEQKRKPYIKQLLKLKDYTEQLMEVNQGVIDNLDNLVQDLKRICEPPEQKHEFKPFDKVLVRCQEYHKWEPGIFKSYDTSLSNVSFKTFGDKVAWNYCIPYEGNEHLVGTTDKPKEEI